MKQMILMGTIVNTAAIIIGSLAGWLFRGVREDIGKTVMQGIGLAVILLGLSMGLETKQFLLLIVSLVLGGMIGEWLNIEEGLLRLGNWVERRFTSGGNGKVATAFVTATLVYTIGSMAILGSLESGLKNDHQILYTKAMLDGFSSIIFTSTLGIGVIFSAIPVFLYQGIITVAASWISQYIAPTLLQQMIQEITAVGGLLIVGIGINLLEIAKIRVANLLPAIFVAAFLVYFIHRFSLSI
ncbi:putative membrane protein, Na+ channel or pump [[Clostridium] ultunense Esp]|nr:putative membrane protein, Na+ channel or pump [[Clostridium] ultunense Esp]